MTKHTPGPWVLSWGSGQEVRIDAPSGDPTLGYKAWRGLASTWGCEDNPVAGMEVAVANARLIAAAPELLGALEEALLRCEDCSTCGPDIQCPKCAEARAIVRRARGQV